MNGDKKLPFARSIAFAIIEQLEREGCFKNCTKCENFDVYNETCKLWPNAGKIPINIAVVGCASFEAADDIPF